MEAEARSIPPHNQTTMVERVVLGRGQVPRRVVARDITLDTMRVRVAQAVHMGLRGLSETGLPRTEHRALPRAQEARPATPSPAMATPSPGSAATTQRT